MSKVLDIFLGDREKIARYAGQKLGGCRDRFDGEDVAQIIAFKVCRDQDTVSGISEEQIRAWVWTVTRHTVRSIGADQNNLKRSVKRTVHLGAEVDFYDQRVKAAESVAISNEEAQAVVEHILGCLPETQAEAIRLRYLEGKSSAEIAEAMELSVGAVSGLLKRGLARLRSVMSEV